MFYENRKSFLILAIVYIFIPPSTTFDIIIDTKEQLEDVEGSIRSDCPYTINHEDLCKPTSDPKETGFWSSCSENRCDISISIMKLGGFNKLPVSISVIAYIGEGDAEILLRHRASSTSQIITFYTLPMTESWSPTTVDLSDITGFNKDSEIVIRITSCPFDLCVDVLDKVTFQFSEDATGIPESTLGNSESTLGNSESTLGNSESTLGNSESTFPNSESTLGNSESTFPNSESTFPNSESTLGNPESTFPNSESTLGNPESTPGNSKSTLANSESTHGNSESTLANSESTLATSKSTDTSPTTDSTARAEIPDEVVETDADMTKENGWSYNCEYRGRIADVDCITIDVPNPNSLGFWSTCGSSLPVCAISYSGSTTTRTIKPTMVVVNSYVSGSAQIDVSVKVNSNSSLLGTIRSSNWENRKFELGYSLNMDAVILFEMKNAQNPNDVEIIDKIILQFREVIPTLTTETPGTKSTLPVSTETPGTKSTVPVPTPDDSDDDLLIILLLSGLALVLLIIVCFLAVRLYLVSKRNGRKHLESSSSYFNERAYAPDPRYFNEQPQPVSARPTQLIPRLSRRN